jgi:hypothetical protein
MDDLRLTKKSDDQLIGACPFKRNMMLEIIDLPFLEWKVHAESPAQPSYQTCLQTPFTRII